MIYLFDLNSACTWTKSNRPKSTQ